MKIAITGATGFVGSHLTTYFKEHGHSVVSLGRELFDESNRSGLYIALMGVDVVINLAGASISQRWTRKNKEMIYRSRIETTKILVDTINSLQRKPSLFISTSAVGYYSSSGSYTEATAKMGNTFLSAVCHDWEEQARRVTEDVRCVITRFGLVFSAAGGLFPVMTRSAKFRFMVQMGDGEQYLSWISIDDLVRVFDFIITKDDISGVVNLTAPRPVTNRDFTLQVSHHFGCKLFFSINAYILRKILGEQSLLLIEGQRVYPERLIKSGFEFKNPSLNDFLINL